MTHFERFFEFAAVNRRVDLVGPHPELALVIRNSGQEFGMTALGDQESFVLNLQPRYLIDQLRFSSRAHRVQPSPVRYRSHRNFIGPIGPGFAAAASLPFSPLGQSGPLLPAGNH